MAHPSFGEAFTTIYFDATWWQVSGLVAEVPQPDGRAMYRQIEPPKDTKVTLLFETVTDSGEIQYTRGAEMVWGDGPELLLDAVDPGEYMAAFIAETITGNSAVASTPFKVKESAWLAQAKQMSQSFKAADLVGTWDHFLVGDEMKPSGLVFEISPHPRTEGLLVAKVTSTKQSNVKITQVLWPDTRLVPGLRFFEYDDKGNEIGFYLATFVFGVREGKQTLFFKMADVTRMSAALIKRGGAAEPGTPAPAQPGTPPAQPGTPSGDPIAGKWQDELGTTMVCQGGKFAVYVFGELVSQGTYQVRGNRLIVQDATGEREEYTFAVRDGVLILQDSYGDQSAFRRVE
jgi:hypothetical protein